MLTQRNQRVIHKSGGDPGIVSDYGSVADNQNQCLLMNQLCKVCGEPAAGFHFGAFTCEGCKSFFGRTYNNVSGIAECKNGGRCEINKKNRTSCKSCRLRKCLRVGMSKSGSRYGRRSNWFKIHCLLQAQGQQNGIGQGPNETNNNNSTITNNNSPTNYQSSFGKNQLPSTITSYGSLGSDRDHHRDRDERERTPSSSASRNGTSSNGGLPPSAFTSISSLSPDSLSSLNRKLNSSDLADYFRAAGMANMGKSASGGGKSLTFSEDERGEDMSRTTRSPGSLESPRSETSMDDGKSSTPLFTMPPGSPLDVKPNDLLSFDLLTRDLMKMGYDPLRLWPAMFNAQPNLHQFNPYRFMFPNFPGAAAFPGAFPPNPNAVPPPLLNGGMHPGKLFSAAGLEGLPSPLANLPNNLNPAAVAAAAANLHHLSRSHSPNTRASPPNPNRSSRGTPIVPPSSSLTLTPPISHHGSEDPTMLPLQKLRNNSNIPHQEKPIDLSAKSTNNNHVDVEYHDKMFTKVNGDISDDDEMCDNNDSDDEREYNNSDVDMKNDVKSDYDESDNDDTVEDLSSSNNNNVSTKITNNFVRRLSSASRSHSSSPPRASTPLDLTRGTSSNSSPPTIAKIAT